MKRERDDLESGRPVRAPRVWGACRSDPREDLAELPANLHDRREVAEAAGQRLREEAVREHD